MEIALLIILITLLVILTVQDFKYRAISWFLTPLLFVGFIGYALLQIRITELIVYFGINLYIVFCTILGVTLFISIKEKKLTNILKTHLGLGDMLFFMVITVVFSPFNFIFFYIGGIIILIIVYSVIILFNQQKRIVVPLAGAMSLLLVIVMIIEQTTSLFKYYQDFILN